MRLRAQLQDGGQLELFEYITPDVQEQITRLKHSYHWQSADGLLVRRSDAVNHHPELPHAPHHVHLPSGQVQGVIPVPDVQAVLEEIQANLGAEDSTDVGF